MGHNANCIIPARAESSAVWFMITSSCQLGNREYSLILVDLRKNSVPRDTVANMMNCAPLDYGERSTTSERTNEYGKTKLSGATEIFRIPDSAAQSSCRYFKNVHVKFSPTKAPTTSLWLREITVESMLPMRMTRIKKIWYSMLWSYGSQIGLLDKLTFSATWDVKNWT